MGQVRLQKSRRTLTVVNALTLILIGTLYAFGLSGSYAGFLGMWTLFGWNFPQFFALRCDGYGYRALLKEYVRHGPRSQADNARLQERIPKELLNRRVFPKEFWRSVLADVIFYLFGFGVLALTSLVLAGWVPETLIPSVILAFFLQEVRATFFWFFRGRLDHFCFTSENSFRTYLQLDLSVHPCHLPAYLTKARAEEWLRER